MGVNEHFCTFRHFDGYVDNLSKEVEEVNGCSKEGMRRAYGARCPSCFALDSENLVNRCTMLLLE